MPKTPFNIDNFDPTKQNNICGFNPQTKQFEVKEELSETHAGIYIFWWKGNPESLTHFHLRLKIKGKQIKGKQIQNEQKRHYFHNIEWNKEWMKHFGEGDETYFPLYVGKSTNVGNRIKQHIAPSIKHEDWKLGMEYMSSCENKKQPRVGDDKNSFNEWKANRLFKYDKSNYYRMFSPTTACQLRSGLEILFSASANEELFWNNMTQHVCLTIHDVNEIPYAKHPNQGFTHSNDTFMPYRFYLEDYLIGALRPWFNLDSER